VPRHGHADRSRYAALAVLATVLGAVAVLPAVPSALSAALLLCFVGVGPGCTVLCWTGRPGVSRLILVPALGLSAVIVVSTVAATAGWWSPPALFAILAAATLAGAAPHLPAAVRDVTR